MRWLSPWPHQGHLAHGGTHSPHRPAYLLGRIFEAWGQPHPAMSAKSNVLCVKVRLPKGTKPSEVRRQLQALWGQSPEAVLKSAIKDCQWELKTAA